MDAEWLSSPAWSLALTMAERDALLRAGEEPQIPDDALARARRRRERWQSQPPFGLEEFLAQRLAAAGLTPDRWLTVLATPAEELHARLQQAPAWATQWAAAFAVRAQIARDEVPSAGGVNPGDEDEPTDEDSEAPAPENNLLHFLQFVNPLIDLACSRLQAGVADLVHAYQSRDANQGRPLPFEPEFIEDILLMNLPDPLLMRISRTLVLELHVARLQGFLDGDTPAARFESFIERLRQPEHAQAILVEYPVLARQLTAVLNQWTDVCLEFLSRLCDDWDLICRRFSPDEAPGVLVALAGGAGDTHRGGRTVMIATFDSGFRLVYKPKSLQIDARFQELLTWLNDKGCDPPLQTIDVLDRGHYGWVEHVAYRTCETRAELQRFYRRHGAYLALLYALNANDFHFENLIAVGEDPVLIDLETVLQPRFDTYNEELADGAAVKIMAESVLQVGLLPMRLWSGDDYAGIDISGLGGNAGQLTPDRIPRVTGAGTDEMRYVRERVEIEGDANRPSLNDEVVNATEHLDDILEGFQRIYRLIATHRDELSAADGLLARFAHDVIRILIRPTRTYDQLLFESFHPDLLRNALDRDQFLDRLWAAVPFRAYLAQVVPAELEDLHRGDIPLFESTPSALHLVNGAGMVVDGVLLENGLDTVRRRLERLGEEDIRRQVWLIRASLATIVDADEQPTAPAYRLSAANGPLAPTDLLQQAVACADRLLETAVTGTDDACWIGLYLQDTQTWDIRTLDVDLGHGMCGVVLFLAYAGALTQDERYTTTARRGLRLIDRQIEILREELRTVGAHDGWGGVLFTLTHLAALWQDAALLAQADSLVDLMANLAVQDENFDVARGAAGALLALLAHHAHTGSEAARNAATACGNHLVASAKTTDHGLTWAIPSAGDHSLHGTSHGRAGIIWALLELAAITDVERYRQTAQSAMTDLRAGFAPELDAWPERHQADLNAVSGIGPAWVAAHQHLDNPRLAREIDAVIQTTLAHGFGNHHSFAGGDLGSLEVVQACAAALGDAWTHDQAANLSAMIHASLARDGFQCGGPLAVELPGMLLGLAGIGYQLLRLAAPDRVPSLLRLAAPQAHTAKRTVEPA